MRRLALLLMAVVTAAGLHVPVRAYASPSVGFNYVRTPPLPYMTDSPFALDLSGIYYPTGVHRPSAPAYDLAVLPAEPDEDISDRFPDPVFRMYIVERILGRQAVEPYPIYGRDLAIIQTVTEADFSSRVIGLLEDEDNGIPRIRSMEGIHYFVKLKTLECYWNWIEQLDLRGNRELEFLSCYTNYIGELYLGDQPHLTKLWCNHNRLQRLDVSGCPALRALSCGYSRLTQLNLQNNPLLTYLSCASNPLTYLDLRHQPALENLHASGCGLRSLDLSNNTQLTDLAISTNELTRLDITMLPELTSLYCSGNWLQELDTSRNRELTRLMAGYNLLQSVDLSNNPQLYTVSLHENRIATLDLRHLTELKLLHTDEATELLLPTVEGLVHHHGGAYERDRRRYPPTRPALG